MALLSDNRPLLLQVRSREGLTVKTRLLEGQSMGEAKLQRGEPVQEWVRVLPSNLGLTVALDNSLERIERVDATSAFANVGGIAQVVGAGEQPADCVLGKLKTSSDNPERESYGLFSPRGYYIRIQRDRPMKR
ncbi:MAG: hypothetical protein HC890_06525 [Chloroflexaceae bacterium]|nr:hypothetical protein [Chloroflexaceae bacterium]